MPLVDSHCHLQDSAFDADRTEILARALETLEAEARDRWPLEDCLIIHRHGRLDPGDNIVLVATASPHRKSAFESCEFLIDWLKTKAPFWKHEEGPGGARWVEARAADDDAASRWTAGESG